MAKETLRQGIDQPHTTNASQILDSTSLDEFTEQVQAHTDDPDLVCSAQIVFLHQKSIVYDEIGDSIEEASWTNSGELQIARIAAMSMRVQARLIGESCRIRNVSQELPEIFDPSPPMQETA